MADLPPLSDMRRASHFIDPPDAGEHMRSLIAEVEEARSLADVLVERVADMPCELRWKLETLVIGDLNPADADAWVRVDDVVRLIREVTHEKEGEHGA